MTVTLTIPTLAAGDVELTSLNAMADLIEAAYNTLEGANLRAASVPVSALAKGKAELAIPFFYTGDLMTASVTVMAPVKLPNVDGASNSTWKLIGWSIGTTSQTAGAGNQIEVQVNGVTITGGTINMNNTTYNAVAVSSLLATPLAMASADTLSLKITDGGAGTVVGLMMVFWFTLAHVGT